MPIEQRIALYRRVLGFLRLSEKPIESLSFSNSFNLKASVFEAMLISGVMIEDAKAQIPMIQQLLRDALDKHSAMQEGFINE